MPSRFLCPKPLALSLGALALFSALPAQAHEQEDGADRPWFLVTGLGLASRSRYLGSDRQRIRPFPIIEGAYRSSAGTFSIEEEAGTPRLRWGWGQKTRIGLQLSLDEGRKEKDDPDNLRGLGNIKKSVEYGVFASHDFGGLKLKTSLNKGSASGHDGLILNLDAEHRHALSERLTLVGSLGLSWANGSYMQRYFGVSEEQSANSALPTYSAKSGLRDTRALIGLKWQATPKWLLLGGVEYIRLLGDAEDSPVVRKANQIQFGTGFAYLW